MELILADGLQVQLFGAAVEIFGKLGDIMDVAALGGGREVAKAHIVDHALTQWCHAMAPWNVDWSMWQ
jgi:hypothetical protein